MWGRGRAGARKTNSEEFVEDIRSKTNGNRLTTKPHTQRTG